MPSRPGKACRKSGCKNVVKTKAYQGYCEEHKDLAGWFANERAKGNRHQRGYDNEWQNQTVPMVRELAKGLCQNHLAQGQYVSAVGRYKGVVEHIIPKDLGGTNDLTNLSLFCTECARAKTRAEKGMSIRDIWLRWGHTSVAKSS